MVGPGLRVDQTCQERCSAHGSGIATQYCRRLVDVRWPICCIETQCRTDSDFRSLKFPISLPGQTLTLSPNKIIICLSLERFFLMLFVKKVLLLRIVVNNRVLML